MRSPDITVRLPWCFVVRLWAAAMWRAALAVLLGVLAWQAWQLRAAYVQTQRWAGEQADKTRAAALQAVADTRKDLLIELAAVRNDLLARTDRALDIADRTSQSLTDVTDARLKDATAKLDANMTALNATVDAQLTQTNAEITKARLDVLPLVKPVQNILDVASINADLMGRCAEQDPVTGEWYGNVDCVANRAIPALKSMEHVAKAGDKLANEAAGAVADLHVLTSSIVAPQPWYKRLYRLVLDVAGLAAMGRR